MSIVNPTPMSESIVGNSQEHWSSREHDAEWDEIVLLISPVRHSHKKRSIKNVAWANRTHAAKQETVALTSQGYHDLNGSSPSLCSSIP